MRSRVLALVALSTLLVSPCLGAEKPLVRVHWNGRTIRVDYKTVVMTYEFRPAEAAANSVYSELFMAKINKISTDYLLEKDGVVYMILDIAGNSRGPGAEMSMCGAGEEKGKGFFVFNEKGEVKPPFLFAYESCFYTMSADLINDEPPANAPAGKVLTQFEHYRMGETPPGAKSTSPEDTQLLTVRVYFDEEKPEGGLKAVETCVLQEPLIKSNHRIVCPAGQGR